MTAQPSLLRFILERLDHDEELVLLHTPAFLRAEHGLNDELATLLEDRGRLLRRLGGVREVVQATALAMKDEQDSLPIHDAGVMPVTRLGDTVLKTLATRWDDHPDYNPQWKL